MNDAFAFANDQAWKQGGIFLAGEFIATATTHCDDMPSAKALWQEHYLRLHSLGGAIIIGNSSELSMVTVEEAASFARLSLPLPTNDPFWLEVVVFRQVTFQQMLQYIRFAEYGKGFKCDPESVATKASNILLRANNLGPMCFRQISRTHVSIKYLAPISEDAFSEIIESVLSFNQTYFTMQLGKEEWRRQFRSSKSFSLGPC